MDTLTRDQATPSVTLPARMQAVVAYEPGDYRLEEVDVPRSGPDDIKTFIGALSFWSDKLPLSQFKHGFDLMKKGEGSIKIVLIPE